MIDSTARHGFVTGDGLRLHYVEYGLGPPVVCLHGVTGFAWMWDRVAERLASDHRVIAMDLRGHGDSQWSSEGAYTTEDHVGDLERLVASLGLEGVGVVGASWGGLVGLAYAARHPDAVERLALVDIEPSFEQGETDLFPRPGSFASHADAAEWERKNNPHAADDVVELLAAMGTRPGPDGQLYRKHDPFFLERWPFRADDRWEELRGLQRPVLVAHASQTWVRTEVAERMANEAPNGSFVQIQDSGHTIAVEQPEQLAEALEGFLKGSPA